MTSTAAPIPNMGHLPNLAHLIAPSDTPSSPGDDSLGDPLVCQWQGCTSPNHPSPEALYDHVCEQHIGRKSTNNLNLQCFWGSCRTTTVKRDHITSHIRVHVPLKPHKCDFCGKSFKRPQDLKKHVKTHADESVLFNSPQNNATNSQQAPNGYQAPMNGKDGSYEASHNQHLNYPYGANAPYNGGNGIPSSNLASLYGYNSQPNYGGAGLTESRKRTHDALNDFFGDVKRRNIDGGQYQDLGARFNQFLNWFAPMSNGGWANGYNSGYGGGGFDNSGLAYQTQHVPPMGQYNNPFPELRTKNDLLTIDQFLEQLQHTVYENPVEASAQYQPVAGMQHAGFQMPRRSSNSPPRFQGVPNAAATPSSYSSNSFAQSSNMDDTPALTPSSFQTTNSPKVSNPGLSPNSRPSGSSLYPTLPSFSALPFNSMDQGVNAFGGGVSSGLPPSGLGPQYDDVDGRRRYSGGFLQRARQSPPAHEGIEKDLAEGLKKESEASAGVKDSKMSESADEAQNKLPGVSQITRESEGEQNDSEEGKTDAKQDTWTTNLKTIEALREYVKQRLQKCEFEREESDTAGDRTPRAHDVEMKDQGSLESQSQDQGQGQGQEQDHDHGPGQTTPKREGASLYPVLRPVES